ncbi:MAG: hypothetical protein M1834_001931 [Cirrosporium novae-zelandiae]|nr:MAG: hypothetical protein M1834_001931 [Cirrosporium novae-zelandiae]
MIPEELYHAIRNVVERSPDASPLAEPIPIEPLNNGTPTIVDEAMLLERGSSSTSSASATSTCGDSNTGVCEKPADANSETLPIVLGAAIPLFFALVVLVFLHRRHVKKLKLEDLNDKHKSLDFGMDDIPGAARKEKKTNGKGMPEMTITDTEKEIERSAKGMSMDMGNPYLLPPEVQNSRESIHSLSRGLDSTVDDPYRPVASIYPNDGSSVFSGGSRKYGGDDASSYADSIQRGSFQQDDMRQRLLKNAQRMSQSLPPSSRTSMASNANPGMPQLPEHAFNPVSSPRTATTPSRNSPAISPVEHSPAPLISLNNSPIEPSNPQQAHAMQKPPPRKDSAPATRPPKLDLSAAIPSHIQAEAVDPRDSQSDYGDGFKVTPPSPTNKGVSGAPQPSEGDHPAGLNADAPVPNMQRRSMGFRPLPPEDPADNPEQRANRIRSFYKEYFDDSKPGPVAAPETVEEEDDYDPGLEYLTEGAMFDPVSGQFIVAQAPYAEPITRRAMTPPPRAPPRFQGPGMRGPPRHQATMSGSGPRGAGPRAFSSVSSRPMPKKKLPPPAPLHTLPTPAQLKDDSFLPLDIAPPPSWHDRIEGRPASPMGRSVPVKYQPPPVPGATPLASAFEELAAMPSPYALRKSGTFTGLDFAPPPRFKNSDTASDAGSIRSNRSGISTTQQQAIRAGAYRVSRIPKEVAGTKVELATSLKPKWDIR